MFEQLIGTAGRINRLGYLARAVPIYLLYGVGIAFINTGASVLDALGILLVLLGIFVGYFAAIRRMHDFGWGGPQILLMVVPVVNIIVSLMLFFRPGQVGDNDHGIDPDGMSVGYLERTARESFPRPLVVVLIAPVAFLVLLRLLANW